MIRYHLMTEKEKEIVSDWKYDGAYEIYNMPSYEEQKEKGNSFGNPERSKNFYSYYDEDVLIGFTNILEKEKEVFVGIGVAPDLCGRGYGQQILECVTEISQKSYPDKPLYLEVRTWNRRAIRCYEKAGFQIDGDVFEQLTAIGNGEFYRMIKN